MKRKNGKSLSGLVCRLASLALIGISATIAACGGGSDGEVKPTLPVASVDRSLSARDTCTSLLTRDFTATSEASTSLTSAELVTAAADTKEFCKVTGVIQPSIGFEIRLPTKSWNGRYFQVGCGGFCGGVNIQNCADMLAQDFVVAAQDMGHKGDFLTDATFGADPVKRATYGRSTSTHALAVASKSIIASFYGAKPAYNYFRGCSTGGREGLSAAQYFPDDFDGIVAGDPAFGGRLGAFSNNWDANHLLDENNSPVFSAQKLAVLSQAVLNSCDQIDGLKDGIIDDPRSCKFDPKTLLCPGAVDEPSCLTAKQVAAAIAVYDGPRNSKGERLSPGTSAPYGSELAWNPQTDLSLGSNALRYLMFSEPIPDFDYRKTDWDSLPALVEKQVALYDPVAPKTRPDLTAFKQVGGKLIAYHGWADHGVPPEGTLDYYATSTAKLGGISQARDWFRVFMVPGMNHCRGGDAPNTFDFMPSIIAWVEQGRAPDGVIATQFNADQTVKRTRPLAAYPSVAKYTGVGDVNNAANWQVTQPNFANLNDTINWLWAAPN